MLHTMGRYCGLTLVKVLVVCAVALTVAIIAIPGMFSSGRASNERQYYTSLKTLASAEADFRGNDRDWNLVQDYWTADVKGLYTLTSAAVPGAIPNTTADPSIKLIELSLAAADADGTFHAAEGENVPMSEFAVPSAKAGYWFAALRSDLSTKPATAYARHAEAKVVIERDRHESKFGFMGFPDSLSASPWVIIVNESNTIYRIAATTTCRASGTNPPGVAGIPAAYLNWPDEATLKSSWSKLD